MEGSEQAAWSWMEEVEESTDIMQHNYYRSTLGGLVARPISITQVHDILDVSCGAGSWSIDMVKTYPHIHIHAIDGQEALLRSAEQRAAWSQADRLTFSIMDSINSLAFAADSFDFVHAQPAALLHVDYWPEFISEMKRVLRPNGWLNIVVLEPGIVSSDALTQLTLLTKQAFHLSQVNQGHVSSSSGDFSDVGAGPHLYRFFMMARMTTISYTIHALDLGFNSKPGVRPYLDAIFTSLANLKQHFCSLDLITSAAYDRLYDTAYRETMQPHFCGFGYLFSVVGRKPSIADNLKETR